ncbi:MAG: LPS export ABC transporter periplasmic protein LptC [Candidatus Eisenbacteria bacterium]
MADPGHLDVRTRVAALGFLALLALVPAGCASEEPVVMTPRAANLPSQEVTDFEMKESDTGRPEWILVSKYAATYSGRGLIVARDVVIDFYDSEGEKYSRLTAREGTVQQPQNDMEARGKVVVTTTDGVRIETESLRFLNGQRRIVSDQYVRLERNGDVVTGIGFESDPSLEHFSIKREVRAQVQSSPGGGLRFKERGTR